MEADSPSFAQFGNPAIIAMQLYPWSFRKANMS